LTILTTQLELSLWESDGVANDGLSWRSFLSINESLEAYFVTAGTTSPDLLRMQMRIRTFCWNNSQAVDAQSGSLSTTRTIPAMMAAANDAGDILLLFVSSADNPPRQPKVVYRLDIEEVDYTAEYIGSSALDRRPRFVNKVVWSPWIVQPNGILRSCLAYAFNGAVKIQLLDLRVENGDYILSKAPNNIEIGRSLSNRHSVRVLSCSNIVSTLKKPHDPISYFQQVKQSQIILTFESIGSLVISSVSLNDGTFSSRSIPLSNWSPPTALRFLPIFSVEQHQQLHLVTYDGSSQSFNLTCDPEVSILNEELCCHKPLKEALSAFDADNDLGGKAKAKIWGLAHSPNSEYTAIISTFHPGDLLEYSIPVHEYSTVFYEKNHSVDVKLWNKHEVALQSLPNIEGLLMEVAWSSQDASDISERIGSKRNTSNIAIQSLLGYFETLIPPDSSAYINLKSPNHKNVSTSSVTDTIKSLVSSLDGSLCYTRLCYALSHVGAKAPVETRFESILQDALESLQNQLSLTSLLRELRCNICSAPFRSSAADNPDYMADSNSEDEDPQTATCNNGHSFVRCALTAIPICGLGWSKYCRVCGLEYLSTKGIHMLVRMVSAGDTPSGTDDAMQGISKSDIETGKEKDIATLRALVSCSKSCFFCGGRFVNKRN
jgi:hypothetical protein